MTSDPPQITWRKSTRSQQHGECVEVAVLEDTYAVRDSKNPDGGMLNFGGAAWANFTDQVKQGAFAPQHTA